MASKRLSPTANLLRNSRLFSLPPPLPRPSHDFTAASNSHSDTATLPYPTLAAIETTQTSLSRGDWGLKRSLPQKSTTKTTTPTIRIEDVDSIDHITDFESAADHTLTLRKWQEIGLSLSLPASQKGRSPFITNTRLTTPTSVFEAHYDNTEAPKGASNAKRWKFKGPWLAGQTDGDFEQYIEKHVRKRKLEFREYLRKRIMRSQMLERRRVAQANGEILEEKVKVSDSDLDQAIKHLRHDETRLHQLVEEFLDLPTVQDPADDDFAAIMDNEKGPPKTHLSAGLSYLRTNSHVTNHPILGPMEDDPPIQARVLQPQVTRNGFVKLNSAILGVGGVAGEDSTKRTFQRSNEDYPGIKQFEPDIEGGAKIWVHPDRANVDAQGRIKLHILRAEKRTQAIYEGILDEPAPTDNVNSANIYQPSDRKLPKLDNLGSSFGRPQGYGLESSRGSGRAKPLDVQRDVNGNSAKALMDLLRVDRE